MLMPLLTAGVQKISSGDFKLVFYVQLVLSLLTGLLLDLVALKRFAENTAYLVLTVWRR